RRPMTPPPKRPDDARAAPAHASNAHTHPHAALKHSSIARRSGSVLRRLRTPLIFLLIFAAVFLLHLTLVNLPYYWDEAGYFIPAARDIYADCSFIPHSTLSNAHPPLVMAYLALAWKLFGFRIAVARVGMLLVSSFALTGVFRLV